MQNHTFKSHIVLRATIFLLLAWFFGANVIPLAMGFTTTSEVKLNAASRASLIDAIDANMRRSYVFPEKADAAMHWVRRQHRQGVYDTLGPRDLVRQLTEDLRLHTDNDLHLRVRFSATALPAEPAGRRVPTAWDKVLESTGIDAVGRSLADFGVEGVEILPQNIAYLRVTSFRARPHLVADRYAAAMEKLAGASAMIIDLRDNGGGNPESVALLASYFFDTPAHLSDIYVREDGKTVQSWTRAQVSGPRFGGSKPVYILTSRDTFSAGEEFAYDLQALGRAKVIGESTGGGAHPTAAARLAEHFFMTVPFARSINPTTGTNWEGSGVIPDLGVEAPWALKVARKEILRAQLLSEGDPLKRAAIKAGLGELN